MGPQTMTPEQMMGGGMRQPTVDELPLEGIWQGFSNFFTASGMAPMGYPQNIRRLFSPEDNVHGAIVALCNAARLSIGATLYDSDEDAVDEMFSKAQDSDTVRVNIVQNDWTEDAPARQIIVIDGIITILRQKREALFILDPIFATETAAVS